MKYAIHLDTFSGGVGMLTKKQHRDHNLILRTLLRDPMVSTWDISESRNLQRTIKVLETANFIVSHEQPFPWHKFVVTKLGKEFLEVK